MDALHSYLSGNNIEVKTKDTLEGLGKVAAAKYVSEGVPMNDTIRSMAKDHTLNNEQVKRVAETANNEAFNLLFKKEAGYVTFPVADPAVCSTTPAYSVKIARAKYVPGSDHISTEELGVMLFGETSKEESHTKIAMTPDLFTSKRQAIKHVVAEIRDAETDTLNKLASLQNYILNAVQTEEATLQDVADAMYSAGNAPEFVKTACAKVGIVNQMSKRPEVDFEHDIIKMAKACRSAAKNYRKVKAEGKSKINRIVHGR